MKCARNCIEPRRREGESEVEKEQTGKAAARKREGEREKCLG